MNKIITLPNSRVFDLEKDRLTTEDYKCLTGEEVRHIWELKRAILEKIWEEDSKRIFEETGMILHYN